MFPRLGPVELILILVIVTMLFGVGKLPEMFGAVGRGVKEFRKASEGDDTPAPPAEPVAAEPVAVAPVVTVAPVAAPAAVAPVAPVVAPADTVASAPVVAPAPVVNPSENGTPQA